MASAISLSTSLKHRHFRLVVWRLLQRKGKRSGERTHSQLPVHLDGLVLKFGSQIASSDELSDNVHVIRFDAETHELDDVGMRQTTSKKKGYKMGLLLQLCAQGRILRVRT